MPRVKRGLMHSKRRKNILKKTKGYKWGRKKLIRLAQTAINKAGMHAFAARRKKKANARALWHIQLNAAIRELDEKMSFSKFMGGLKKLKVELDRKVLSEIAREHPEVFKKIVDAAKK